MKKLLQFFIFLLLLVAGAGAFFLGKKYMPSLIFQKVQKHTSHWQKTNELNVQKLETLQISNQYVFPYDFMKKPYPQNWAVFNLKNSVHYRDNSENMNKNFYETIKNMGIDLAKEGKNFLILRAEIRMGFNLSGKSAWLFPTTGSNGLSLKVILPEPEILAFNLEILPQKEGWPSMAISPESWSLLSNFLETEIRRSLMNEQTLALVKDNAQNLLQGILEETEFRQIDFVYQTRESEEGFLDEKEGI